MAEPSDASGSPQQANAHGERPWLTIVTAVYNDVDALARTLRSVATQDTALLEELVVDGGSTDGTAELAYAWADSAPWVRVVSEPDTGIYNAMNKGIRLARGQLILFLNAGDDFATPDSVHMAYEDWVETGYTWGRYLTQMVDQNRQPTRPLRQEALEPSAFERGNQEIYHQGALMSRQMLMHLGGFDERFRIVADFELMCRALQAGYRPYEGGRVLTYMDTSGVSTTQWQRSLREEHRARVGSAVRPNPIRSLGVLLARSLHVGMRRGLRHTAEATIGTERMNRWRGLTTAASAEHRGSGHDL